MNLIFEQLRTGGDRNLAYLLGDRAAGTGVLIDPSFDPEGCVMRAAAQDLKIAWILNTHGHHDHINGNAKVAELTGAPVAAHPDCPCLPDRSLQDGEELAFGSLTLRVLHTPGHCEDHVVFYEPHHRLLFSGDLLFVGKTGGTKDDTSARTEFNSLRRLISELPPETTVWPGHDYGARPSSTLALELAGNPFLQCASVMEFLRLKDDWPIFKSRYGLK